MTDPPYSLCSPYKFVWVLAQLQILRTISKAHISSRAKLGVLGKAFGIYYAERVLERQIAL